MVPALMAARYRGWRALRHNPTQARATVVRDAQKRRRDAEHQEQRRLFVFLDAVLAADHPGLTASILDTWANPNGGLRSKRTAARLQAEGVRRGVPDLSCMVPANGYFGLVIELKAGKGRPTLDQAARLERLRKRGYRAECAAGWIAAARLLTDYLGVPWRTEWATRVELAASIPRRRKDSSARRARAEGANERPPRTPSLAGAALPSHGR